MPASSSQVPSEVAITTTPYATSDNKVGIMTTCGSIYTFDNDNPGYHKCLVHLFQMGNIQLVLIMLS